MRCGEAADRGCSPRSGRTASPTGWRSYSEVGEPHVRRDQRQRQPTGSCAARSRGEGRRRRRAACARTGRNSSRRSVAARAGRPAPDDDQLAPHRRRGGLHRRRLRGDRVRRRRTFRRRRGRAARARARLARVLAVGGDDRRASKRWDDALAAQSGEPIDDPVVGRTMLYTSGTTGRPKGVHRPSDPRARPRRRLCSTRTTPMRTCTCAPDRCTTRRRSRSRGRRRPRSVCRS